jgi:hypothetical protein
MSDSSVLLLKTAGRKAAIDFRSTLASQARRGNTFAQQQEERRVLRN